MGDENYLHNDLGPRMRGQSFDGSCQVCIGPQIIAYRL
jgi:hypothetical protein